MNIPSFFWHRIASSHLKSKIVLIYTGIAMHILDTIIHTHELIVVRNRLRRDALLFLLMLIIALYALLERLLSFPFVESNPYISFSLLLLFLLCGIFIAIRFCTTLIKYLQRAPSARLGPEGFWLERIGTIPWRHIAQVGTMAFEIEDETIVVVGIQFKEHFKPNLSMRDHLALGQILRFDTQYDLLLRYFEVDPQEVVRFAKQFLEEDSSHAR